MFLWLCDHTCDLLCIHRCICTPTHVHTCVHPFVYMSVSCFYFMCALSQACVVKVMRKLILSLTKIIANLFSIQIQINLCIVFNIVKHKNVYMWRKIATNKYLNRYSITFTWAGFSNVNFLFVLSIVLLLGFRFLALYPPVMNISQGYS